MLYEIHFGGRNTKTKHKSKDKWRMQGTHCHRICKGCLAKKKTRNGKKYQASSKWNGVYGIWRGSLRPAREIQTQIQWKWEILKKWKMTRDPWHYEGGLRTAPKIQKQTHWIWIIRKNLKGTRVPRHCEGESEDCQVAEQLQSPPGLCSDYEDVHSRWRLSSLWCCIVLLSQGSPRFSITWSLLRL